VTSQSDEDESGWRAHARTRGRTRPERIWSRQSSARQHHRQGRAERRKPGGVGSARARLDRFFFFFFLGPLEVGEARSRFVVDRGEIMPAGGPTGPLANDIAEMSIGQKPTTRAQLVELRGGTDAGARQAASAEGADARGQVESRRRRDETSTENLRASRSDCARCPRDSAEGQGDEREHGAGVDRRDVVGEERLDRTEHARKRAFGNACLGRSPSR